MKDNRVITKEDIQEFIKSYELLEHYQRKLSFWVPMYFIFVILIIIFLIRINLELYGVI